MNRKTNKMDQIDIDFTPFEDELVSESEDCVEELSSTDDEEDKICRTTIPSKKNPTVIWTSHKPKSSRRQSANSIDNAYYKYSGLINKSKDVTTFVQSFNLFIDGKITNIIIQETNRRAQSFHKEQEKEWQDMVQYEFKALIGVLLFGAATRSNKEAVRDLWNFQPGKSRSF
ncbi:hypothetical protein BLOT_009341 [Blomia tropicalis]|nr:hypothetical protein BLOT_009341 [Blomia tropicalis]